MICWCWWPFSEGKCYFDIKKYADKLHKGSAADGDDQSPSEAPSQL